MRPFFARLLYFGLQSFRHEPVRRALTDVRRTEFWPLEKLQQLQAERMLAQLRFALAEVPYYQEFFAPFTGRIRRASSWDEVVSLMSDLPVVSKYDVQMNYERFIAKTSSQMRIYPDKTSGSTGTPLVFPCDQSAWAYRHAMMYRNMAMYNVSVGEPYVYFFGLHWDKRTRMQVSLKDFIFNRVRVSAFDLGLKTFNKYFIRIQHHHPTHFLGYPSAIYDFCFLTHQLGYNLREFKLKVVFTTGEPLLSFQRELIEDIAGCRCSNQYGSAEGGFTVFECPDGKMHLNMEACWLRLQDSNQKINKAVVTDMMLRAFPLVNYAIEDDVSLEDGICSCGREHTIISSVDGRSGEPILLPNNRLINSHLPGYIFKPLAALKVIRRYRFVLKGKNLRLYLIVSDNFSEQHLKIIEHETKEAFGRDIVFSVHIVDEMEYLPNAKHKSFIVLPK